MEKLGIDLFEKNILENEFFDYFRHNNKLFDDAKEILNDIKKSSLKTGILTDVPYGRKEFVEKDIVGANNAGITSILINRTDKIINYGEKYQFKNLRKMWDYLKS
jgi:FMN phosphatase YigB (HAD superfamily)